MSRSKRQNKDGKKEKEALRQTEQQHKKTAL